MSGQASALEVSWTSLAALGLVFSAWLALNGWSDFAAVRASIREIPPRARSWGPRWWVALSAVVANALLCLVWVGFILIGVIAMHWPPPPPSVEQQTFNIRVGWLFIAMEAILAFVQGWHLYVRGQVKATTRSRV